MYRARPDPASSLGAHASESPGAQVRGGQATRTPTSTYVYIYIYTHIHVHMYIYIYMMVGQRSVATVFMKPLLGKILREPCGNLRAKAPLPKTL